jgi:hypothetical protein
MPLTISTQSAKNATGASFNFTFADFSGIGNGPWLPLHGIVNTQSTMIDPVTQEQLPAALGQTTKADSLSVAIASDQELIVSVANQIAISNYPTNQEVFWSNQSVTLSGTLPGFATPPNVNVTGTLPGFTTPPAVVVNSSSGLPVFTSPQPAYAASGLAPVIGSFIAAGPSNPFKPVNGRSFNITISGTFTAIIQLERSFDGNDWFPLTQNGQPICVYTAPCSESFREDENVVQFRLNCTTWTVGAANYRLSQ